MTDVAQPPEQAPEKDRGTLRTRLLTGVGVVALVIVVTFMAISVLPRWWSQRIGDQIDGDLTTGLFVGIVYGFLATFLPILVLYTVWKFKRTSIWAWVIGVGLALVLAAPNLITLGIEVGSGSAAHAADRTLDVDAPWYVGGTVIGVVLAFVVLGFLAYLFVSRSRARRHADEAREKLAAQGQ